MTAVTSSLRTFWLGAALLAASCAARSKAPAPDPGVRRLADADALVRVGCYLCLTEAVGIYESQATAGRPLVIAKLFDASLLLALRQKEIGLPDGMTLASTRATLDRLAVGIRSPTFVAIAEALPPNPSISSAAQAEFLATRFRDLRQQTPGWKALVAPHVSAEPVAAYLALALECDARFGGSADPPPTLDLGDDSPILQYRRAICRGQLGDAAAALLEREPRFVELQFLLGLRALGQGRLTTAERMLSKAHESLPQLPALTLSLANLYLALEEPDRALQFYARTLELVPDHREALLGQGKAASYLRRHALALPPLDRLIELDRTYLAEAHYWRGWDYFWLKRLDEAWADALRAKSLWVNGSVFKLAGLIANARGDLGEAELNFAAAWKLSEADCEAGLYLGSVRAERRAWETSAPVSAKAADCYVQEEADLRKQVEAIQGQDEDPARKARQVARRNEDLKENARLQATAAYQAAAAYWNIGARDPAATYARRAALHEQFRERAEKLLGK